MLRTSLNTCCARGLLALQLMELKPASLLLGSSETLSWIWFIMDFISFFAHLHAINTDFMHSLCPAFVNLFVKNIREHELVEPYGIIFRHSIDYM